jgi:hypothetical protein
MYARKPQGENNVIPEEIADHQPHSREESYSGQERGRTHLLRQHQRAQDQHEGRHGNHETGDESRDEGFDETGNESRNEGLAEVYNASGDEGFLEGLDQASLESRLLSSSKNFGDGQFCEVSV